MATVFYGALPAGASASVASGVGSASGAGVALGVSVTPGSGAGSASATSTATAVGDFLIAPGAHHVALPREPVGTTTCECVAGQSVSTGDTTIFPDASN